MRQRFSCLPHFRPLSPCVYVYVCVNRMLLPDAGAGVYEDNINKNKNVRVWPAIVATAAAGELGREQKSMCLFLSLFHKRHVSCVNMRSFTSFFVHRISQQDLSSASSFSCSSNRNSSNSRNKGSLHHFNSLPFN